jgi:hypothetical protein
VLSRLARVVLAAVLLAGWQGALLHPLQHFDKQGGFVHLADGHAGDQKSGKTALCDTLAALTACAGNPPVTPPCIDCTQQSSAADRADLRAAQAPPFFSQGPPVSL